MEALEELLQLGFEPITLWLVREARIKPASVTWQDTSGWVYAFAVDHTLKYVGKTVRLLRERLDDYTAGKDAYGHETQCGRINSLIAAELSMRRSVDIYGWKERSTALVAAKENYVLTKYRGLHLWNRAYPSGGAT